MIMYYVWFELNSTMFAFPGLAQEWSLTDALDEDDNEPLTRMWMLSPKHFLPPSSSLIFKISLPTWNYV